MARRERRRHRSGRVRKGGNRLDRNLQVNCETCNTRFKPLQDLSIKKMVLLSLLLVVPAWIYFNNRFKCPSCGISQIQALGKAKSSR